MKTRRILFSILLMSLSSVGFAKDQEWAAKRVNQHMQQVGTKMYYQQQHIDAMKKTIELDTQVNGLEFKKKDSSIGGLELEGVDYGIDVEHSEMPVESTENQLHEDAYGRIEDEEDYRRAKERYIRQVKETLKEAGIRSEIDENMQVHTYEK